MKMGRPLNEIAAEIQANISRREDYISPGEKIEMTPSGFLRMEDQRFNLSNTAHGNLSRRLEIPKVYYDKMRVETPDLLSDNVNVWLKKSGRHMIRSMQSVGIHKTCRAVLSERYRRIDNDAVMEGLYPILNKEPGMRVESCEITETKFYLKAVFPALERDVGLNDPVQSGVVISNSEVGYGSTSIAMLIYRLACLNGMIVADEAFKARKNHVGKVLEFDDNFRISSDETQDLQNKAFLSHLADIIKAAADPNVFHNVVSDLQDAAGRKMSGNVEETVENITRHLTLTQDEGSSVLENLVRDGDYSQWGLANAVTRTAQDALSYDRASDLERFGGKVINLKPNEWEKIAA